MNSTAAGGRGGVAEILNRLVPLMRELGLNAEWRVIRGGEEFFRATKAMHNVLQGGPTPTVEQLKAYERWREVNASESPWTTT